MLPELNRHMGEEEIERYSMGLLSHEEAERVEQHLLLCTACQELVNKEDGFIQAIRTAGAELDREQQAKRAFFWSSPIVLFAAAAIVLLVFAGVIFLNRGTAAPVAVDLHVARGDSNFATAPRDMPLVLNLDITALPPQAVYRVAIVDQGGGEIWRGEGKSQDANLAVTVPRLAAGVHFVRVYSADGQLLREYGLEVGR